MKTDDLLWRPLLGATRRGLFKSLWQKGSEISSIYLYGLYFSLLKLYKIKT